MSSAKPDSKFDFMDVTMECETALVHTRSKNLGDVQDRQTCLQFDLHNDVSNRLKEIWEAGAGATCLLQSI